MKTPSEIYEDDEAVDFLQKRGLTKQYKKAKEMIKAGMYTGNYFGQFQPKSEGRRYFRINQQYRAMGKRVDDYFVVSYIDDHSNS